MQDLHPKVLELIKELSDPMKWNWTRMVSERNGADRVLMSMARLEIIEHREHQYGGAVWVFNGTIFGRRDGVILPDGGLKPLRK